MKKNLFVLFTVVLSMGMLLSACGGGSAPATEAPAAADSSSAAVDAPAAEAPAATDAPAAADNSSVAAPAAIAPMTGASELSDADKADAQAIADSVAKSVKLAEGYNWEAWQLPVETTWDDVLAYYDQQTKDAGWNAEAGTAQDIPNGKLAVFGKSDGTRLVLIYVQKSDKVEVLAVFGK